MKDKKYWLDVLKKYVIITFGCFVYSIGVALFLDPKSLAAGGVTGIAIVLNSVVPKIDTGVWILIFNVPLLVLGLFFFGFRFTLSTLFATGVSSGLIVLWPHTIMKIIAIPTDDYLICSVVGGMLYGLGLGIIFRMGSTTGGTDIVVKILRKKFRHIKTGILNITIDITIISIATIVFNIRNWQGSLEILNTCYTVLALTVFTVAFDFVLYGNETAKLTYIITTDEYATLICDRILKELDISATYIDGEGAYSNQHKRIIMCAVKKILYPKLRDIIQEIDPTAFTIVGSAKEIYGEGYKTHFDEEL